MQYNQDQTEYMDRDLLEEFSSIDCFFVERNSSKIAINVPSKEPILLGEESSCFPGVDEIGLSRITLHTHPRKLPTLGSDNTNNIFSKFFFEFNFPNLSDLNREIFSIPDLSMFIKQTMVYELNFHNINAFLYPNISSIWAAEASGINQLNYHPFFVDWLSQSDKDEKVKKIKYTTLYLENVFADQNFIKEHQQNYSFYGFFDRKTWRDTYSQDYAHINTKIKEITSYYDRLRTDVFSKYVEKLGWDQVNNNFSRPLNWLETKDIWERTVLKVFQQYWDYFLALRELSMKSIINLNLPIDSSSSIPIFQYSFINCFWFDGIYLKKEDDGRYRQIKLSKISRQKAYISQSNDEINYKILPLHIFGSLNYLYWIGNVKASEHASISKGKNTKYLNLNPKNYNISYSRLTSWLNTLPNKNSCQNLKIYIQQDAWCGIHVIQNFCMNIWPQLQGQPLIENQLSRDPQHQPNCWSYTILSIHSELYDVTKNAGMYDQNGNLSVELVYLLLKCFLQSSHITNVIINEPIYFWNQLTSAISNRFLEMSINSNLKGIIVLYNNHYIALLYIHYSTNLNDYNWCLIDSIAFLGRHSQLLTTYEVSKFLNISDASAIIRVYGS
jgi:hypothetical protein